MTDEDFDWPPFRHYRGRPTLNGVSLDWVRERLDAGAHVDAAGDNGLTLLHVAAREGREPFVELALAHGADVHRRDDQGRMPIHLLFAANGYEGAASFVGGVLARLREHGTDVCALDGRGNDLPRLAIAQGWVSLAEEIWTRFPATRHTVGDSGEPTVFIAIRRQDLRLIQRMVEAGADLNEPSPHRSAFHCLLASDVRRTADSIRGSGDEYGNIETPNGVAGFLAELGARASTLGIAAYYRLTGEVERLIACGADVEEVDPAVAGRPLYVVARRGHVDGVRALLAAGANSCAANESGIDLHALHGAANAGSVEIVELLLNAGERADVRDLAGRTPLHCAALGAATETIERLLRAGADADVRDEHAERPVDKVAMWYHVGEFDDRRRARMEEVCRMLGGQEPSGERPSLPSDRPEDALFMEPWSLMQWPVSAGRTPSWIEAMRRRRGER